MKISRDKINHISSLIVKDFEKRDEMDYSEELNNIRLEITRVMTDELKVDDAAEEHVRTTLESYSRGLREGTEEWEILYNKHYNEYMSKHGL